MSRNKLADLLLNNSTVSTQPETGESLPISKFGLDQIINVHETIQAGLSRYDPTAFGQQPYDPLVEIAKLAYNTEDDNLKFNCHKLLASYKYPSIRSLEIRGKEDREIHVTIDIAGYAKGNAVEIEPEDIETEDLDPDTEKYDYLTNVLNKDKDLG